MRRREFIIALGTGAAWPLAAGAQQSAAIARMGYLGPALDNPVVTPGYAALIDQLRKLGFTSGQNCWLSIDAPTRRRQDLSLRQWTWWRPGST